MPNLKPGTKKDRNGGGDVTKAEKVGVKADVTRISQPLDRNGAMSSDQAYEEFK